MEVVHFRGWRKTRTVLRRHRLLTGMPVEVAKAAEVVTVKAVGLLWSRCFQRLMCRTLRLAACQPVGLLFGRGTSCLLQGLHQTGDVFFTVRSCNRNTQTVFTLRHCRPAHRVNKDTVELNFVADEHRLFGAVHPDTEHVVLARKLEARTFKFSAKQRRIRGKAQA